MTSHIYHGLWINWDLGAIQGITLTLNERNGGLLTAFIATFVTIVGAQLWRLLAYVFHQVRSRDTPQDGLYHQQQVILRNTSTPGGAAWNFLQQSWYWSGKVRLTLARTLPWAVFAIAYICLFGVLAVYSSDISKSMPNTRLVIGKSCGYWSVDSASTEESIRAFQARMTNTSYNAAAYARDCYGGAREPLACTKFVVPDLSYKATRNISCPFGGDICLEGAAASYKVETAMLDTQRDLGINSPKHDRVQVQKSMTCSPLKRKGYASTEAGGVNLGRPGDLIIYYNYGPIVNSADMGSNVTNYTFSYNNHTKLDGAGYSLDSLMYSAGSNLASGGYEPIRELNVTNADLTVISLSANSINYAGPTDDPFFSAHINNTVRGLTVELDHWSADAYTTIMGCVEQYKICNPNNNKCLDPVGASQIIQQGIDQGASISLSAVQQGQIIRIAQAMFMTSPYYTIFTRGASILRASEVVSQQLSQQLPNNQWQMEVDNWFDVGLAAFQQRIVEYATGPTNVVNGSHITHPAQADLVGRAMCYSQLILDSADTTSFSVLGMAILFSVGGLIVLLAPFIDIIVGWIQATFNIGPHMRMSWLLDDKLQLHRMVCSEMSLGQWSNDPNSVPYTLQNQIFLSHAAPKSVYSSTSEEHTAEHAAYKPQVNMQRGYVHVLQEEQHFTSKQ